MDKITTKVKTILTLTPIKGYRTYLAAALMIILAGLKTQGYIDEATFQIIATILGGFGLAALRAGAVK